MRNEPCTLDCDVQLAGDLVTAHALFTAGHQVDRHQPFRDRPFRFLEYRSDPQHELLAASLAPVGAGANGGLAAGLGG